MKMIKMVQLQDICLAGKGSIISGPFGSNISSKYFVDEGIPVIRGNNLKLGMTRFIDEGFVFVTDEKAKQLHTYAHVNDIIFTSAGTIGQVGIIPPESKYSEYVISNKQLRATIDETKAIPLYVFYWLSQPSMEQYIMNLNTGSTIPLINLSIIKALPIPVPDLEVQKKIVSILDTFDTKIKINNEINENLLQQAKTLFKSWFVDFDPFDEPMIEGPSGYQIPQSLKMVQIQDLPHILETGKRPKGGAVSEGIPSVGAENVKQLGVFDSSSAKFIPREFAMSMKKGKIEGYELLLYKDGGKPGTFTPHFSMFGEGFPYEEFYINEHVFKLDFNDRGYNEFAYLYMQTDYPYHWLSNNGGKAAIPGINQHNVNEIWIYHPSHPLVQEFCRWVQPLFTTIFTNCAENMKLSKLRDTLLPKLMSGELDLSELDL